MGIQGRSDRIHCYKQLKGDDRTRRVKLELEAEDRVKEEVWTGRTTPKTFCEVNMETD